MKRAKVAHVCDLKLHLRSSYIERRNLQSRIRNFLSKNIVIWNNHFATSQNFKSNRAIEEERQRHIHGRYWYLIHPFSKMNYIREIIMFWLWLLILFKDPLMVGFLNFLPSRKLQIKRLFRLMDSLTLLNCALEFFVGYKDKETQEIILDHRKIVNRYLKTYFFTDVISAMPFGSIYVSLYPKTYKPYVKHLANINQLLRGFRFNTVLTTLWNFFSRNQEQQKYYILVSVMISFLFALEYCTCILFYVTHEIYTYNLYDNSWYTMVKFKDLTHVAAFLSLIKTKRATMALFFNIDAHYEMLNDVEYVLASAIRMVGYLLTAIMLGIFLVVTTADSLSEARFNVILRELQEFANFKRLPPRLTNRLINYYKGTFKGRSLKSDTIEFPRCVLDELMRHKSRVLFSRIKLLADLPPHVIQTIILHSTKEYYLINDVIQNIGSKQDSIFILLHGGVALFFRDGTELRHFYDGSIIGDIAFTQKAFPVVSAIAIEFTEVLCLPYKEVETICKNNTEFLTKIAESAQQKIRSCKMNMGDETKVTNWYIQEAATSLETKVFRYKY